MNNHNLFDSQNQHSHVGIYGSGLFGSRVQRYLTRIGRRASFIDNEKTRINGIRSITTDALPSSDIDAVYVAIGNDEIAHSRYLELAAIHPAVYRIDPKCQSVLTHLHPPSPATLITSFLHRCKEVTLFGMRTYLDYAYYQNELSLMDRFDCYLRDKSDSWKHRNAYRERPCPICGSNNHRDNLYIERNDIRYARCQDCDFVFINPFVDEGVYSEIYLENFGDIDKEKEDFRAKQTTTKRTTEAATLIYQPISAARHLLHSIDNLNSDTTILDFGCGYGTLVSSWFTNFNMYGMDIDEHRLETARKKIADESHFINFFHSDHAQYNDMFDAILADQNIEHLLNPKTYFSHFSDWLKNDGKLVVAVPNADSFATRVLGEKNSIYCTGHVSMFNKKSMTRALRDSGFKDIRIKTKITDITVIDIIKSIFGGKHVHRFEYIRSGIVYYPLFPFVFAIQLFLELLVEVGAIEGNYLIVTATKAADE